jgi:Asp-tRNA(Asn)/Glu-tRNA(Gln) amidotransferase A subunit family amidase
VVRRLRQAGALILGKSNLSEWANFRSSHSTSGWSARGGQTHNPYALDRNPCGSSSGSAVAVAADLTLLAIATETDGSIVCPSSINGIVGMKPTVGLVSRSGIIPISSSQDTAGPVARTVADAALLLTVIAGYDPEDPATAPLKDRAPQDYRQALRADSLRGARVGVLREYAGFQDDTDARFEAAIATLRSLGAVIVDPVSIATRGKFDSDETTVLEYDATLARDHLDVLVAPTQGPAWLTDPIDGDHAVGGDISSPPAVAGYPHITVPMQPVHGLPVGLSFVGTAWSEAALIGYAYAFEQATHYRSAPRFAGHASDR